MDKYNLEEIKEKLERCKNIPIEDINPNDVDDIEDIKISRKNVRRENIRFYSCYKESICF